MNTTGSKYGVALLCLGLGGGCAADEGFGDDAELRAAPSAQPPTCEGMPDTDRSNMSYAGQPKMDGIIAREGSDEVPHRVFMDVSDACGDDVEVSGIAKIHDSTGAFANAIAIVGPLKKKGDDPLVIITARIGDDGLATDARCNRFNLPYHTDPEGLAAWSGGLYVAEENPEGSSHDGEIHYFSLDGIDGDGPITATMEYSFASGITDDLEGITTTEEGNFLIGTGKIDHVVHACGGDPGSGGTLECDAGTPVALNEASSLGTYCEGGEMKYTVSADSGNRARGFASGAPLNGRGEFEWRSNKGKDEAVELIGNQWFVGYDDHEGKWANEIHIYGYGGVCLDADGDGHFGTADFVVLGQSGVYEQPANCVLEGSGQACAGPEVDDCECNFIPGECNGDYRYTSADLVEAFQLGHYEG